MIWFRRQKETKKVVVAMTLVEQATMLVGQMLIHLLAATPKGLGKLTHLQAEGMKEEEMQVETHLREAMKVAERQIHLLGEMTQVEQKVAMLQLLGMLEQKQEPLMLDKERLKVSLPQTMP